MNFNIFIAKKIIVVNYKVPVPIYSLIRDDWLATAGGMPDKRNDQMQGSLE